MSINAGYLVSLTPRLISVSARDLETNGMVLTKSALIPADRPATTFSSASEVADYFGAESAEAVFAQQYFTGLTNQQKAPSALIIGRRIDEDAAAWIHGAKAGVLLADLKKIKNGAVTITVNGAEKAAANIDLSAATSLSQAAETIATAITGVTGTYDSNTDTFTFTTETKGANATVTFAGKPAAGTDLGALLKLTEAAGAVLSQGAKAQTESETLDAVVAVTANFSQFTTLWEITDKAEAAAYSAWADVDDDFVYVFWSSDERMTDQLTQSSTIAAALEDKYNCTLMLFAKSAKTAAFAIAYPATIKWDQPQGMKVLFAKSASGLETSVTSKAQATALDELRVSYIGQFATRNDEFQFANRGALASDLYGFYDTLIGSIWLRSKIQTAIMNGFASVNRVPYNERGYTILRSWITDPLNQALSNGAIDSGLVLSESQRSQIIQETGTDESANDIESVGYWLSITDPGAAVRAQRDTPVMMLYVGYAGAVQKVSLPVTTLI